MKLKSEDTGGARLAADVDETGALWSRHTPASSAEASVTRYLFTLALLCVAAGGCRAATPVAAAVSEPPPPLIEPEARARRGPRGSAC